MDLGATICRPLNPKCDICPISMRCKAYDSNQQSVLPINIKKVKNISIHYITGIISKENQYFLIKNPKGLLENLYGLKQYECNSPYEFIDLFQKEYNTSLKVISYIKDIKHVFSHRTWIMHVYHFELKENRNDLYTKKEMSLLPISTAHLKVLNSYFKEN